jgi:predicted phage terminase large subunit-like protein
MPSIVRVLPMSRAQREFLDAKEQVVGFVGGIGAGKTRVGALKVSSHAKPGDPWMCVSPDAGVARETTFPTFLEVVRLTGQYISDVLTPYPKVTFRTRGERGQAELLFRSAESPAKLRGANKAGIWIDEASIIDEEVYNILVGRLRWRGEMGQILATFTPCGTKHWTFGKFFKRVDLVDETNAHLVKFFNEIAYVPREESKLVHCKTRDNPFAPEQFADAVAGNYSAMMQQQELDGEFVDISGLMFKRQWFKPIDQAPANAARVRYWDKAATSLGGCFTAGVLMARDPYGTFYIEDVIRGQWNALERNTVIEQTAARDANRHNNTVSIYFEQEGGSSGKEITDQLIMRLCQYPVYRDMASATAVRKAGSLILPGDAKIRRAMPFAACSEAGNVRMVRGDWNADWIEELVAFPEYKYCDQVDATSAAYQKLAALPPDNVFAARMNLTSEGNSYGELASLSEDSIARWEDMPWNKNKSKIKNLTQQ